MAILGPDPDAIEPLETLHVFYKFTTNQNAKNYNLIDDETNKKSCIKHNC